jgi:hypothetical protein
MDVGAQALASLEHFQAKWIPVRVKKIRKKKAHVAQKCMRFCADNMRKTKEHATFCFVAGCHRKTVLPTLYVGLTSDLFDVDSQSCLPVSKGIPRC